ncbi:PREDICTED: secretoglobin family 1D member-like [Elephantulus edwardii]|uniref:secretoglobin family 1D member-like n=1 Tax=Elephantulus edwardii TaxID=28737 RepID=UPI0003F0AE0A|nr:PREDICTED: secretoglobin family 1D member-like [Elephantulus edwardii]
MRLSISLLLVTLALCSYQANGVVCPSLMVDMKSFVLDHKYILEAFLRSYGPPEEYVQAKMEVKKCVDEISLVEKMAVMKTLVKVLVACGVSDVHEFFSWPVYK